MSERASRPSTRRFAWQSIRARRAGFVAAFLAVLGGAVLVTACGVLLESGLFAGIAPQRYAAAPVVVGAAQSVRAEVEDSTDRVEELPERAHVPAEVVAAVAAAPGVRSVVADVSVPVTLPGGAALLHGWGAAGLTPFTLVAGAVPVQANEVVLDAATAQRAGVGVGSAVEIAAAGAPVPYRVAGIAAAPMALREGAVFVSGDQARALGEPVAIAVFGDVPAGAGTDLIGLVGSLLGRPDTLVDRVEATLSAAGLGDRAVVRAGVGRGEVEFLSAAQSRFVLLLVSGSFTGFVLMIVVIVVAGTLSLLVHQRRREIALLRAVAATPRQVHRMLAAEVVLVAGAAALIGVGPGYLVAAALRDGFARIGVIADGFALSTSPAPAVAAILLCLVAARVAVWAAARRAVRVPPVEALRESAVERSGIGRVRVGAGRIVLVLACVSVVATVAVPARLATVPAAMASMLAVIGVALLGPRLMGHLSRLAGARLLRSPRAAGYLAAANSNAASQRLAAAVTPLVLTIGFATSQFYSQTTLEDATRHQAQAAVVADHVLTAPGGVAPEVAAAARSVPGVAAATMLVGTEVVAIDRGAVSEPLSRSAAFGIDAGGLAGTLDLPVAAGALADLHGDAVALSETEAGWLGKRVGDRVELVLGDGTPVHPRVVAIYRPNLGFGDVLLPSDVVLPHTTDGRADAVLVSGPAGLQELARRYPGMVVGDRTSLQVAQDAQLAANAWLNRILLAVLLGYVALSVATTLVTITTGRAREFALLRLVGGTRRQVARMLGIETAIVAGIAVGLGTLVAAVPLVVLAVRLTGTPLPAGPPWVYAGIVAAAVLTGVLSIRIPAARVQRGNLLDAVRDRG